MQSPAATVAVELLQNGTMVWLGQKLQLTTQSLPIVRAISSENMPNIVNVTSIQIGSNPPIAVNNLYLINRTQVNGLNIGQDYQLSVQKMI